MLEAEDDYNEEDTSAPSNLPEWTSVPSISDLEKDLTSAKSDHSTQVAKIDRYLDNLHVRGSAAVKKRPNRSSVQTKLIRKQAEWRYAALSEAFLSTENMFSIRPTTHADKLAARQNNLIINNQFNTQIEKVAFIDEYVRTAVDEGTIIVRIGWEEEIAVVTRTVQNYSYAPTNDPTVAKRLQKLIELSQSEEYDFDSVPEHNKIALQYTQATGIPHVAILEDEEEVSEERTVKNQPTLEICHYKNVVVDPSCEGKIEDARFVGYNFTSSLSGLKAQGIYFDLDKIRPGSNEALAHPDYEDADEKSFEFSDKARKELVVTEYWGDWDIHDDGTTVPIVAAWVGNILIRMEENPFPDRKPPFEIVQYLPVRKAIYGEPDGVLLEDNQKIAGALTRAMIDIVARSANGQRGVRNDALNITNRRKFKDGDDFEFQGQTDPSKLFYMNKMEEIPQSAPLMLQMQNQEAESLTGVRAFAGGISGDGLGDVATGIRGALDAASKRELGILRRMSDGLKRVARRIIAMNGVYLSEQEYVRVTDDVFADIRRDDLAGNFDLVVDISSAEVDNAKAQELAFMLQTMGNNMMPELSQKILANIARLRKMPALAKELEEFKPTPDPLAQREQELRIAVLEAELQKKTIEPMSEQAKAVLDRAKAVTEASKARKLDSEADINSLDFVEKESGTTQERDLQKQKAQAQGNMELEIIKKQLENSGDKSQNN